MGAGEAITATRKQYSPKFKERVAIEAIRGEKTLSQWGSQFKVHPMQIFRLSMRITISATARIPAISCTVFLAVS